MAKDWRREEGGRIYTVMIVLAMHPVHLVRLICDASNFKLFMSTFKCCLWQRSQILQTPFRLAKVLRK